MRLPNLSHAGTGGHGGENAALGFRAAFFDTATCTIHLSRFADGRLAPMHLMDGLPDELVLKRSITGRVLVARHTVMSGFERNGFFYTRSAAARAASEWDPNWGNG